MSSDDYMITAHEVGKAYHVFTRPEDRLKQMLFGWRKRYYREFWALRNFNIHVRRGESIGIVGRNGSGKSTLLQLVCGTLEPTEGELCVNGRIAALLELGTGFNPEFTGRENVFLNAQILGLDRAAVEPRFDKIAGFADIGEYIDQPVKTYSSGMFARLAFAVAIHVDPEILVIDEALSVGDEAFQRKCFARLRSMRDAGVTVLFVSHGASAIIELCDRAVLLDHGQRLLTGEPKIVVAKYQRFAYASPENVADIRAEIAVLDSGVPEPTSEKTAAHREESSFFDPKLVPESTVHYDSRGAIITDPIILDADGRRVNVLVPGKTYMYRYTVAFERAAALVRFGMLIKTVSGFELGGAVSHTYDKRVEHAAAGETIDVEFHFRCMLQAGVYFLNAGVMAAADEGGEMYLHRVLDAAMFRVQPNPEALATAVVDFDVSVDVFHGGRRDHAPSQPVTLAREA